MVLVSHDDCYHYLAYVLGAYLMQDYFLYGPRLKDAVLAYMGDESELHIAATRADIERFLANKKDYVDAALDQICSDRAQPGDLAGKEYLQWIDRILAGDQTSVPDY